MLSSFSAVLFWLMAGIFLIVVLTARFRVHAFFALLAACFLVGIGMHMPFETIMVSVRSGFGNIMRSLGVIIVLGTTLGVVLEHTGATAVMANYIVRKTGPRYISWAITLTGFIVGLPIFCDSGYLVLSGISKSLAARTRSSIVLTAIPLATGLYSVHCLLPPHPGATSAAATIGAPFGMVILVGLLVAFPAMLAGYAWASFAGRRPVKAIVPEAETQDAKPATMSAASAFLPVIVPVVLISVRSFLSIGHGPSAGWYSIVSIFGEPEIALVFGILLAVSYKSVWRKGVFQRLLAEGVEKAGGILVIIGAGGAFGAVLAETQIGKHFSEALDLGYLGILFPFLLTCILKTAQGSSTVAIITASSIVLPLLTPLGLNSETGRLLAVLAMGAGSMTISHANDAYFWVISRFSGLDMRTMLKVYSVATLWMGLTSLAVIYLLHLVVR